MICAAFLLVRLFDTKDKVVRYIYMIIFHTLICYGITEVLSFFDAIHTRNLWLCWIMSDIILFVLNCMKPKQSVWQIKDICIGKKEILWLVFAIFMIILAVATVPYNYDSMTYHLPRLYYWLENESVAHYATHIDRQISSPVLAEFVNMHVYGMMNESELLVNLLQCGSYLASGLLVYHIAQKIGCSLKYSIMAAVLFYSTPIAFAEALTTQSDNYCALWMACFTYLVIDLLDIDKKLLFNKETIFRIFSLGLCCGFAYLAKPSLGIGIAVFMIWLMIAVIKRKDSVGVVAVYLVLAIATIGILLAPELARNIQTFGSISSGDVSQRQIIGTLNPIYVFMNFVKNFTFNMPAVWISNSADIVYKGVVGLAQLLHVDINDPRIADQGWAFRVTYSTSHDMAVNPIIFWVFVISILLYFCFLGKKKKQYRMLSNFYLAACLSFFLFCILIRYQPYVSRFMVSYFVVLCPALLGLFDMLFRDETVKSHVWKENFEPIFKFVCIVGFVSLVLDHGNIAIASMKSPRYFLNKSNEVAENYTELASVIKDNSYQQVGLIIGYDSYEYPLLKEIEDFSDIKNVNVENDTGKYEDYGYIPDAIVNIETDVETEVIECHGHEYELIQEIGDNIEIFEKVEFIP